MPTKMSPLRSAMQKHTRSLLCGERSDSWVLSSTAIVWRSALHHGKRGRNGGKSSDSRESMDGGTSTPYSRFVWHENAVSFAEFRRARRPLCRGRCSRLQHGGRHRAPHRAAGLGRVLLAFGLAGCPHVAAAVLATSRLSDRQPEKRARPFAARAPAGGA